MHLLCEGVVDMGANEGDWSMFHLSCLDGALEVVCSRYYALIVYVGRAGI